MIHFSAITDVGKKRQDNQDCYYAGEKPPYVYAVCDGMGGHAAGDIASKCAVECIEKYMSLNMPFDLDTSKAKNMMYGALELANRLVKQRAEILPGCSGMGTTADICIVDLEKLYIGHVGDGRVYIMRRGKLEQITKDHSLVETLIDEGTISREEARTHPNRNVITSALGTDDKLDWSFYEKDMEHGDIVLICSDGVYEMLTDEEIRGALVSDINLDNLSKNLVKEANRKGGADNITAIVLKYIDEQRCTE